MNLPSTLKDHLREARRVLSDLRLPVADLQQHGLRLRIIGERTNLTHLSKMFLGDLLTARPIGFVTPRCLADTMAAMGADADLLFISLSARLAGACLTEHALEIPNLVAQAIELPTDPADLFGYLKNGRTCADLNKIRQAGFTYEISHDPARLREFYQDHYVPYIRQRHGDYAYLCKFEELQREFDSHELLVVFDRGRMIAGSLMRLAGRQYHLAHIGVRGDNQALLQQGAVAAIYYFACLEAIRRDARQVVLGRAIPFLNDGIMFFKKKWQSHIIPDPTADRRLFVKICNTRAQTCAALCRAPFIYRRGARLLGLQWLSPDHVAGEKALRAQLHRICYAGLDRLMLVLQPGLNLPAEWLQGIAPQLDCPVELLRLPEGDADGVGGLIRRLNDRAPAAAPGMPLDLLARPTAI